MKKIVTLITSLGIFAAHAQQISNGGFENWTGSKPDGWATSESAAATSNQHTNRETKTTVSSEVYAGTAAIKITSGNSPLTGMTESGHVHYGSGIYDNSIGDLRFWGVPFAFRPDSFSFAIKYAPVSGDSASVGVTLRKGDNVVGMFQKFYKTTANTYQKITVPITYTSSNTPDTLEIFAYSSGNFFAPKNGSVLLLDEVKLIYKNMPSGVEAMADLPHFKLFPNPAHSDLYVAISETQLPSQLQIIDALGSVVKQTILAHTTARIDVSTLPAGLYFYRLQHGQDLASSSGHWVKE